MAFQLFADDRHKNDDHHKGVTLIPFGSTWKYLDNGSDQGTAWQAPAFDDAAWKAGPAILGYGNPPYNHRGEATKLSFGPDPNNTYITAYFRKTLNLTTAYEEYHGSVKRDDGVVVYVNGIEVFRNNLPKGPVNYRTQADYAQDNGMKELDFRIPQSALTTGNNVIAVEVHQHSKSSSDLTFDLKLVAKGPIPPREQKNTIIPFKSVWKYLDNGTDQGSAWTGLGFDDSNWKSGPAILGYGNPPYNDRGEATKVSFGPDPNNTYITTYFRKTINLATAYEQFIATVRRDDGVVVYVNGVEVFRDHLPKGTINYKTLAEYAQDNGMKKITFPIRGSAFTVGNNVIAVEVHQHSKSSSDLTFDFELIGKGPIKGDTTPPTVLSLNRLTPTQQLTNASAVTFRISFSEQVSGVDIADFALALTGVTASLGTVTPVGTDGKTFDVTVHTIAGNGTLGLNLKAAGTGIADAAGNPIGGGFTGQTYTIDKAAPTVLSINRQLPATETTNASTLTFRATFSEPVTGVEAADFSVALTGTATGTLGTVTAVNASTYDVTVTGVGGNGTVGLNLKATGTGIADAAANALTGGFTGQTYTIQQTTTDTTPPTVVSLNRQVPGVQTTNATSLTFRITFSEAVTGVDPADFSLALTGSTRGTIGTVSPVGTDGKAYDIQVTGVIGAGTIGINLNASGTGIADTAANPLTGGFTGQTYTILEGFVTVTPLTALPANADATREKQQAKVFVNDGRHFAVIADADGTHLWRLEGTTWVKQLRLSTRNNRADAVVDGALTHVLMYGGSPSTTPPNISQFITLEYVPATQTYKLWSEEPDLQMISLDNGVETASLAKDGTDRLWIASAGVNNVNVRWSDAPYTTWSAPITLANNVADDDIAAAVYIAAQGKIGVMWSNQTTDRFGFKTHTDGTDPSLWSADEVPASQSALAIGGGMADDHLNLKVATDGTVYAAVKTSYDTPGTTEIALLVRRPTGLWDNLYEVAQNGPVSTQDPTLPIVVLNETLGKIRVIYTSQTNGGNILYKESAVSHIAFGNELTLIAGVNNFVTSTNQNFSTNIVILASNATQVVGVLASDVLAPLAPLTTLAALEGNPGGKALRQDLAAFPNPFTTRATLRFALETDGAYSLTLYDGNGSQVVYQQKGSARAGALTSLDLDGTSLKKGLYYARLQTPDGVKTLRILLDK
ncbi:MAG: T9SS type A sorting domain-containing protein [Adhaeribacter sp.]